MSDVVEVLYRDTVVVESGDNKVIVIEPKVIINQSTSGGGTWGTITGDIGEQSDLITLFNTKENKNRTILDSDNFDEVTANGKYSANYGSIMLDVANAYGQVFQRAVYQSTNEEKFRWQIGGEWNDWVKLADESDIANLYTALSDSIGDVMSTIDDKVDKIPGKGLSTNDYTDDEKLLLTTGREEIKAQDFVGGTASPYQGLIVGGKPVIVKKFLNQNSYFTFNPFYMNMPTQVYAIIMLTESVMPTAGQYIDVQINGNTAKRYTFNGTETQFTQIEVTDIQLDSYSGEEYGNTVLISGNYAQKVGLICVGVIYSRGV